jgi:hypothetical protein
MGLQQGFTTGEMGSDRYFAWQQPSGPNVRFGSKADIGTCPRDVRFTVPKADIQGQKRTHALQQSTSAASSESGI